MKKENIIKDLSIYNINTYTSQFHSKKLQINSKRYPNIINKFNLECVIGKGGFGKVS